MLNDVHCYLKSQSIPFRLAHHSSYGKKSNKKLRNKLSSPTDSYLLKMRQDDPTSKHIPKSLKMKVLLPFTSYLGFVKAHYKGYGESSPSRVTFVTMRKTVKQRRSKVRDVDLLNAAHTLRYSRKNDSMSEDSSSSGRQLCKKAKMIRIGGIGDKSGISLAKTSHRPQENIQTSAVSMMKPPKPCLLKKPTKKSNEEKKRVTFESPMMTRIVKFINGLTP
ncbi:uncharacterized protein LOC106669212 [Cimex lectularius]|uniref:Uncharacterized protein n=1 Tax=Cimex lectularius TaxID=79782 RepID=A0A8I6S1C6_CIMLE|nr:uncharacterized protein LOC106669212 [Cimex lectularius]